MMRTIIRFTAIGLVACLCGCASQQYVSGSSSLAAPVTVPVHVSLVQINVPCPFGATYLTRQIQEGLASSHIFMNLGTAESVSSYTIIPTVLDWDRFNVRFTVQDVGARKQIYSNNIVSTGWSPAARINNMKKSLPTIGIEIAQAISKYEEIEPVRVVVVKKSPAGRPSEASNPNDPASGSGQSFGAAVAATSEKLAVLKALRERDDITEEEYRERRADILDSLSQIQSQPVSSQSQQQPSPENRRVSATGKEHLVVTHVIATPKPRFGISAYVEDDPAKGDAIMGNGDGFIQKGEAFNLVVVVANASTSTAKSATCTVALPADKSIKAYSELHQMFDTLEPFASTTNRFILAMPLSSTAAPAQSCTIVVREEGSPVVAHLSYELPIKMD